MSGPPLGRKPLNISVSDKKQAAADEAMRRFFLSLFSCLEQDGFRPMSTQLTRITAHAGHGFVPGRAFGIGLSLG